MLQTYLTKRGASGTWQLRFPIPRSQHAKIGRREFTKSLRTTDRALAEERALPVLTAWKQQLSSLAHDARSLRSQPTNEVPEATDGHIPSDERLKLAAYEAAYEGVKNSLEAERLRRGPLSVTQHAELLDQWRWQYQTLLAARGTDEVSVRYASLAKRRIEREGWICPEGSELYQRFIELLDENTRHGLRDWIRTHEGEGDVSPSSELVRAGMRVQLEQARPGERLLDYFDRYAAQCLAERSKRKDTMIQDRKIVAQFSAFVGASKSVAKIDRSDVFSWREAVASLPANAGKLKGYRALDLRSAAAKASSLGAEPMSARTAAKYMSTVSPLFDWLVRIHVIPANPCQGLHLKIRKGDNPRPPFTTAQLNAILKSPLFMGFARDGCEHLPGAHLADDWRFWIPLACLFTGARISEIAQLKVADIVVMHGRMFAQIRHDLREGLQTKSGYGRVVPIHQKLDELGFHAFVERRRASTPASDDTRLFGELAADARGNAGAKVSRFWRDYLTKIGLKSGGDGYGAHSFRHMLADELRQAGFMDHEFGPLILGHSAASVTAGYGRLAQGTAEFRCRMIDAVKFEGVDFSAIPARRSD